MYIIMAHDAEEEHRRPRIIIMAAQGSKAAK
jgi:hypothetical protein